MLKNHGIIHADNRAGNVPGAELLREESGISGMALWAVGVRGPDSSKMAQALKRIFPIQGLWLFGVADGARTRDTQDHNLVLYQLNYSHHCRFESSDIQITPCSMIYKNAW